MIILDIGCGNNKYKGDMHDTVTGLDKVALPGVDVIHDMEIFPYPFNTETFDKAIMQHSLEHVSRANRENIKIIEEVHRILKPSGTLIVEVPIGQWFYYDPTHTNYVGFWYWKYFSVDFPLNYYSNARFEMIRAELVGVHGLRHIEKFTSLLNLLYQKTPDGVERFINFINLDAAVRYTLKKM